MLVCSEKSVYPRPASVRFALYDFLVSLFCTIGCRVKKTASNFLVTPKRESEKNQSSEKFMSCLNLESMINNKRNITGRGAAW